MLQKTWQNGWGKTMAKWGEINCPRCAELEAKLAKAEEMLEREIRRVQKIQRDLPPPHNVGLVYVEAEYKLMLAELKGQDDDTRGEGEEGSGPTA
jgi:hypothetical protein